MRGLARLVIISISMGMMFLQASCTRDRSQNDAAALEMALEAATVPQRSPDSSPDLLATLEIDNSSSWPGELDSLGIERTCEFLRGYIHQDGSALIEEFLRRDSAGEFLSWSPWFGASTTCPGHEPGSDAFVTIAGYDIEEWQVQSDEVAATVRYQYLAGIIPAIRSVRPNPGTGTVTIRAIRTQWGWRIQSPALLQYVVADSVLKWQWLSADQVTQLSDLVEQFR